MAGGDKTLNDVFDLDYDESADRESIGRQWTRSKVENEERRRSGVSAAAANSVHVP